MLVKKAPVIVEIVPLVETVTAPPGPPAPPLPAVEVKPNAFASPPVPPLPPLAQSFAYAGRCFGCEFGPIGMAAFSSSVRSRRGVSSEWGYDDTGGTVGRVDSRPGERGCDGCCG